MGGWAGPGIIHADIVYGALKSIPAEDMGKGKTLWDLVWDREGPMWDRSLTYHERIKILEEYTYRYRS